MFEIIKMLRKESYSDDDKLNLSGLAVGCTVGFGFLPQRNISGCRMPVKAINTYRFDEAVFPTYVLGGETSEINLIITKDEESGETHLSLSQRVEERLFAMLFLSNQPQNWFSMKEGEKLYTSQRVMGMQQSWVSRSYKLAMTSTGTFIPGDHRTHKNPASPEEAKRFESVLFLDEENDRALEAEKYSDGSIVVYATVYRPVTDIGEITAPITSFATKPVTKNELAKFKLSSKTEEKKTEDKIEITTTEETKPAELVDIKTSEKSFASEGMLVIDAKLAGRLIDEAKHNNISIAEVIRKIIDLPASINDQVMINFALSDTEQAKLASRYNLTVSDHKNVRQNIIRELQEFAGSKK